MAPPLTRTLAVLALAVTLLAGCGSDEDATEVSTEPEGFPAPADAWERLPDAPLSPRASSVEVAVGGEVIVVGGVASACPPMALCGAPAEPALSDGASVDLATGEWRPISPAPFPLSEANTAVVDGRAYFWTFDDQGAARFLRYDPEVDEWDELPTPDPERSLANVDLAAAGEKLSAAAVRRPCGCRRPALRSGHRHLVRAPGRSTHAGRSPDHGVVGGPAVPVRPGVPGAR